MSSPTPPHGLPVTPLPSPPIAVVPGRVLAGRYQLGELLATGGMAQVWRGNDEVLRRQVALKLLHPHLAADASFVTRFRQEAVAAARLAHPGIVAIYDTCSDNGTEAIVMELVTGQTLRQRLDDRTPVDPWQAASLAAQVAEALDAAHRAGLIHRDIKPANILLCRNGRVKVADFGIAKALSEADLTQPGLMVGTAKYLSPEQVEGKPVDARTDIYSLGIVLYEMLCGRPPFVADNDTATALARLQRDPLRPRQVRPSVPKVLEEIVGRAMARVPQQRYPSASDLRAALLAAGATPDLETDLTMTTLTAAPAAAAQPVPDTPPVTAASQPRSTFRETERSWLVPTLMLVILAVSLGVAGALLQRSGAGNVLGSVREAITGPSEGTSGTIAISTAKAFDPSGDSQENDEDAASVIDLDPATTWSTERYDNRDITALKDGVGLVLTGAELSQLDDLTLTSPTNGWSASFYVADTDPGSFEGWGNPVATMGGIAAGTTTIDLKKTTGQAVLVWITDRGDGTPEPRVTIETASLRGVPA